MIYLLYILLILVGLICIILVAPIKCKYEYDGTQSNLMVNYLGFSFDCRRNILRIGRFKLKKFGEDERTTEPSKADKQGKESEKGVEKKQAVSERTKTERKPEEGGTDLRNLKKKSEFFFKHREMLVRIIIQVLTFLKNLIVALNIKRLYLDAIVSTPNPALTGELLGISYAVKSAISGKDNMNLNLSGDFTQKVPEIKGYGVMTLRLYKWVIALVRLLVNIKIFRTIKFIKQYNNFKD